GKRFSQIFWVAPDQANELRGNTIVRSEAPERRSSRDYSEANEKKHAKLYKQQKEDDSITNVGDKVDVNYVGRSSGETFSFKNLTVVGITEDSISVKMNEDVFSKKKYNDGMKIVFRKDAVLKIPKHNAKDWGDDNNFKLQLEDSVRNERLNNLNFLKRIQEYAQEARNKGYSIYEDVIGAPETYVKAKYAPFFAKYGNSFDPIKMFDDCKEHITNHFGENTVMQARFGTNGFGIDAFQNGQRVMHTTRNFIDGHQMVDPSNTKGIYHAYFKIDNKKHWGGGLAKKLFCAYYEQYKKMGLQFLSVTAGLESGPYVWPSFGFYGTIEKARQVLEHFKEGRSREIMTFYPEQ
ncbi:MAG TPA: hypothetical protein PKI46_10005, partial [Bacteroidales bacterium]|nr:hypothetical protein [Bacteroidales bacterium]